MKNEYDEMSEVASQMRQFGVELEYAKNNVKSIETSKIIKREIVNVLLLILNKNNRLSFICRWQNY